MTKIKICGLSRSCDIEYVNQYMPDYAGFVFAKSRRQVSLEKAKKLIEKLDRNIKTVGVFVNEDIFTVKNTAERLGLDILQFHGNEDSEYCSNFADFTVWKAVSIKVDLRDKNLQNSAKYKNQIDEIDKYDLDAILLDSSIKGVSGGTGISFDWKIISELNIKKKLVLAGGLNQDNVRQAVNELQPYAVDVSSGVETDDVKDLKKIKSFIEKVRNIK